MITALPAAYYGLMDVRQHIVDNIRHCTCSWKTGGDEIAEAGKRFRFPTDRNVLTPVW